MTDDTLSDIIRNFENHPSILKMEENINKNVQFSFSLVTGDKVGKEINLHDISESQSHYDTPTKIIKDNWDIFSTLLL